MSALEALDAARAAGIEVRLDGKDLELSANGELATDVIDMLRRHKRSIVSLMQGRLLALRQPIQAWDPVDWQAFFDERAGIAEYDGGLPRAEAEARAFDCCVTEWLLRNPIDSSPDRCFECGKSEELTIRSSPLALLARDRHGCIAAAFQRGVQLEYMRRSPL